MLINGGTSFLLVMVGLIILSGFVLKPIIDRLNGGPYSREGLENMQKQNFNLAPGAYPMTLDSLLLSPEYPTPGSVINAVKPSEPATASSSSSPASVLSADYPPPTNNPRHVASPDNDTCMPMLMCNSFYGFRKEAPSPPPPSIPLTDARRRVNYYAAEPLTMNEQ